MLCDNVYGGTKPVECALVASNWAVEQNFFTRTLLIESFLRVIHAKTSKTIPDKYPKPIWNFDRRNSLV
jgi:hypothetical protein